MGMFDTVKPDAELLAFIRELYPERKIDDVWQTKSLGNNLDLYEVRNRLLYRARFDVEGSCHLPGEPFVEPCDIEDSCYRAPTMRFRAGRLVRLGMLEPCTDCDDEDYIFVERWESEEE